MPRSRKSLINVNDTPYYHCVSRCVRRAYLCGFDKESGADYEHRRQWVEDRIHFLAKIFAIDICSYAVMSNHIHTVLYINMAKANQLTGKDVITRWHLLYKGTPQTHAYLNKINSEIREADEQTILSIIEVWRKRLCSISWFMRCLNEPIARKANKEDECTGRFWEGRFKSQALLDRRAVQKCMAYVDLNPIRAKMANDFLSSKHTSIHYRLNAISKGQVSSSLKSFADMLTESDLEIQLPFSFNSYLELLESTRVSLLEEGSRSMNKSPPILLKQLDVSLQDWLEEVTLIEVGNKTVLGSIYSLINYKNMKGLRRLNGLRLSATSA